MRWPIRLPKREPLVLFHRFKKNNTVLVVVKVQQLDDYSWGLSDHVLF
jgi:hypothetical protein